LEWNPNHRSQQNNLVDWEEVNQSLEDVNKVNQELFTLAKLLPFPKDVDSSHRRMRGLINVDVLKLFGVATTQQMQELHTTVENKHEGWRIHAIQKQINLS
jgi:hypothetical protein